MDTMKVYERLINRKKEISSQKNSDSFVSFTKENSSNSSARIELIENAINKLENGDYGVCEHCGQNIDEERLESLPWANLCVECVRKQRRNLVPEGEGSLVFEKSCPKEQEKSCPKAQEIANSSVFEETSADTSQEEFENSMSDEELEEFLCEQLQEENRIETWDLHLTVQDKIVSLDGIMPNEVQYYSLLAILREYIDPEDIVDNISIQDSTGWEDESEFEDSFDRSEDDALRERDEFDDLDEDF